MTSAPGPTGNAAKFVATQLLKVSLVETPEHSDKENRGGKSSKNKITLSMPLTHGFSFSKGQVSNFVSRLTG